MAVGLGDEAPDFTAETTEGPVKFHDWKRQVLGDSVLASQRLHSGVHD
jgi:alkyl hydroperoxide reductase subunit AhpC